MFQTCLPLDAQAHHRLHEQRQLVSKVALNFYWFQMRCGKGGRGDDDDDDGDGKCSIQMLGFILTKKKQGSNEIWRFSLKFHFCLDVALWSRLRPMAFVCLFVRLSLSMLVFILTIFGHYFFFTLSKLPFWFVYQCDCDMNVKIIPKDVAAQNK